MIRFAPRALVALVIAACTATRPIEPEARSARAPKSEPTRAGVVDLHVDLPHATHNKHVALEDAQASPSRLLRGGVAVILAPMFVPRAYAMTPSEARAAYDRIAADFLRVIPSLGETRAWLSFEGADGFADDPSAIDAWMARGACLVGLVHDRGNALGGASMDPRRDERARGLSEVGKALAAHVVARGGILDLAHASDATMDDLLAIARAAGAPVVDSHTGVRSQRAIMRNVDDAHMRAIAESGGVVGISMHGGHVGKIPGAPPTLADYVDAMTHAIEIAGVDHVAIGSDFDGSIEAPPDADGESVWPRVRALLVARGVRDEDVTKIFGTNARRVFEWARAHGCIPGARDQVISADETRPRGRSRRSR